jgi:quercetin dioxygenase-like cupin family protein
MESAGDLSKFHLLTNLDRAALAAYCGAYSLWAEATEAIQKFGSMVKSPSGLCCVDRLSRQPQLGHWLESLILVVGCYSCRPEWGALNEKED